MISKLMAFELLYKLKYLLKKIFFEMYPDSWSVKRQYRKFIGEPLDLKSPKGFNEKIQWLKLNDRHPIQTICADKLRVRDYVEDRLGSKNNIIPILRIFDSPHQLSLESLPEVPFVIKTNHYCGDYEICRDKNNIDIESLKIRYIKTLNCNIYHHGREWQYKNIDKKIIVEALLMDENGKIPSDIKIHCFDGIPKFIYVASDREGGNYRNIFDPSWKKLDFTWTRKGKDTSRFNKFNIDKPDNLDEMLEIASKLSEGFKYVRVDIYASGRDIYVGELTFHQGSGYDEILPKFWDLELGSYIKI
ncbi:ATP-grasp fold amidoligase family protein [Gallaecimonas pentaromativorans]|uniref:ATP-grasp fold amidoligase family protein n=1 Tax=Gallaecimonas pentaromativorans TaxID=584787 RepID=UPI00067EBC71|nr:ATP-grasp fold amidoligase family protein [Gallaecimonas pentaromativorans]